MNTCRFCKSWKDVDHMVKYGVRHYAHFDCYLESGKKLDALQGWQVSKFPYFLLQRLNLLDEAKQVIDRDEALARAFEAKRSQS